jgi:hypothetical protein
MYNGQPLDLVFNAASSASSIGGTPSSTLAKVLELELGMFVHKKHKANAFSHTLLPFRSLFAFIDSFRACWHWKKLIGFNY